MSSKDWENLGEEIRRTVQDAVENQNYEKLNQVISDTINQTVDTVSKGIKNVAASSQTKYHGYKTYTTDRERANKSSSKPMQDAASLKKQTKTQSKTTLIKAPSRFFAVIQASLGYCLGIIMFLVFFACVLSTFFVDWIAVKAGAAFLGVLSGVLTSLGLFAGISGTKKIFRIDRLQRYIATIGKKEYCNVSDLSENVRKSTKTVVKDLEYMISKRWFLQGHLNNEKTCLMITDKMFSEYRRLEQQKMLALQETKQKEQEEQKLREQQIASGKILSPEVQKVIDQGDEYIKKIRACNDAIPGEEISAKIYRIELLVDKIFDRVEQNPKSVSDIRKLMDYYLPTTVKLLEAYAQMDAQPVGGENIQLAKREIEATLDTLNTAFEKLLDSLFQETAWDVSSDISVLNTMLAQEGLKEDGLKVK